jgi:hypothetical protein
MGRLQQRDLLGRIKLALVGAILAGGILLPASLSAQAPKTTHQFEIYLPIYQFLDGTPTMWKYDGSKLSEVSGKGFRYTLGFKERHAFSISISKFHASYHMLAHVPPGEIAYRFFKLRTLDYHYQWLEHGRLNINAFVGITQRRGREEIVVAYPRWWEIVLHSQSIRDWGIHIGMRAEYSFWKRFYASMQLSYTGYIHQYELGPPPLAIGKGPTKNQLALDVGIGYSLPRINFKKEPGKKRIEW